ENDEIGVFKCRSSKGKTRASSSRDSSAVFSCASSSCISLQPYPRYSTPSKPSVPHPSLTSPTHLVRNSPRHSHPPPPPSAAPFATSTEASSPTPKQHLNPSADSPSVSRQQTTSA